MSTAGEPWQPILDSLAPLRSGWSTDPWSWDHRLKCVTSSFREDLAAGARAALTRVVPVEWTSSSISGAPAAVAELAQRGGGLRPGQRLLTAEAVAGMIPYALWWPWGDQSMVSVRLGIANCDRPKDLYPALRALFGIS
jgi:hypothetical protein